MMINKIFRDIVDNSFEGVIIIGDDYRIKYMNRFAGEITGFSPGETEGKFCYEILRAKRCKDDCPIKALKAGKKLDEFIVDIITKDNSEKYIKTKVIHTQDKGNNHWVEIFHDVTREVELEKRIKGKYLFGDIITRDKHLIDILNQFPQIADSMVPVLLEGESGVGKEVFATALQSLSSRKDAPFVKINCASLPDTLLESELFGYKKGAFTDARDDKAGLFRAADKGTLFLDEIGEMSMPLQAKLLRAVETGEIIPLGTTKAEKVNVRFLAATNKNLFEEVEAGHFREDLFYRLNVVTIKISPLRERKSDIPLFIDYFINQFNIIQKKKVVDISVDALEILMRHHYPGNIRELRNIMEYIFIFCRAGQVQVKHIPEYLRSPQRNRSSRIVVNRTPPGESNDSGEMAPFETRSRRVVDEKERIIEALAKARWNKKSAAEALGIDRSTLWRKMKKYQIE